MADPVISWQDVVNIAPELATTPEPAQTAILTNVGNQVPANTWGATQPAGQAYLAAHLATLSRRRGEGPVTARSVGPVSTSFASMMAFGELATTAYGLEYQRLVRLLPTVAFGMTI